MREDLVAAIREFTSSLVSPYDQQELLHRLTEHASTIVDGSGAGIMLQDPSGDLSFVAASEQRVVAAELHQERVESGACYEAFATGQLVVVDDLKACADRWPEYVERVTELGLLAVLGVPMNAFGRTIGVINFYRDEPSPWSADDLEAAQIITTMGAGYVVHGDQMQEQTDLTDHLKAALDSRDLIGQAKGILMASRRIDADEAFEALRSASQRANRKLRAIAEELIQRNRDR